jgi:hypothetical protein
MHTYIHTYILKRHTDPPYQHYGLPLTHITYIHKKPKTHTPSLPALRPPSHCNLSLGPCITHITYTHKQTHTHTHTHTDPPYQLYGLPLSPKTMIVTTVLCVDDVEWVLIRAKYVLCAEIATSIFVVHVTTRLREYA